MYNPCMKPHVQPISVETMCLFLVTSVSHSKLEKNSPCLCHHSHALCYGIFWQELCSCSQLPPHGLFSCPGWMLTLRRRKENKNFEQQNVQKWSSRWQNSLQHRLFIHCNNTVYEISVLNMTFIRVHLLTYTFIK